MMNNACDSKTLLIVLTVAGLVTISHEDLVDGDSEHRSKDHKVVDRWERVTILPLVDRLWVGESEYSLEISYRDTSRLTECLDVLSCCLKVDHRDSPGDDRSHVHCIVRPFRPCTGRKDIPA